ncbi:MAG: hypothetical protein CVV02_18285 [Firmicutes bacterium HGW-Firmicutes-7]|nr:MAG: hypothetical protein CVV02_18285 [Firmicutes bacterium HGW-Firmicutes-7]
MKKIHENLLDGLIALPSFPVVFVTVEKNIMVAAAFHFYSFKPPSVMVGIKPEKYTYELIRTKKEFAINIPNIEQLDKVNVCGSISGKDVNKYQKSNLSYEKSNIIDSYIIKECPVNLECKVVHQINYNGSHRWFIGEIQAVHIDDMYTRDNALMFWLGQFRSVGKIIEGRKDEELFCNE